MTESYFPLIRREPLLVAYWRGNDPAGNLDATDYGARFGLTGIYDGRSLGPALIQSDSGAASSVLTAGHLTVSDAVPLRIVTDISIETWVTPYSTSQTTNLVSKRDSGATHAGPYALSLVSGQVAFSLGNGTTSTAVMAGSLPVSIPSHVVATSFRGAMSVYINGDLSATGVLGGQAVADEGQALIIGPIDLIAETAVYNGALSARRIARHFAIGQQVLSDPGHRWTVDPPTVSS